jgi:hypothetical protein
MTMTYLTPVTTTITPSVQQAFSGDGRDHAGARKLDLPSRFIAPLKSDEEVTSLAPANNLLAARSRSSKIPMEVKSLAPTNLYFRSYI